jgi:hypothetical protein
MISGTLFKRENILFITLHKILKFKFIGEITEMSGTVTHGLHQIAR